MFFQNVKKGGNSPIHYLFTIILVFLGYFLGYVNLYSIIWLKMNNDNSIGTESLKKFAENPDFSLLHIDKNMGFLIILLMFIFALAGLYIGIKFFHKRNFLSLISYSEKIDWKRFLWSTGLWLSMLIIFELIIYMLEPQNYTFRKPGLSFIWLIIISILILPLQTSFEELFVRGYIFQSIAFNTKNIKIGLLSSVLIFAFMHSGNPEISGYGFFKMMTFYLIAGIVLGLLVVFDDRLELAIGVHTATNIFGAVFLTYESAAIQTDSLFTTKEIDPLILAFQFLITGAIFMIIASRKYGWKIQNIREYFKNINNNEFKDQDVVDI